MTFAEMPSVALFPKSELSNNRRICVVYGSGNRKSHNNHSLHQNNTVLMFLPSEKGRVERVNGNLVSLLIPLRRQFTVTLRVLTAVVTSSIRKRNWTQSLKRTSYLFVDLLLPLKTTNSSYYETFKTSASAFDFVGSFLRR